MLLLPLPFQPAHHVRRQAASALADQSAESLSHLARRDALQVQPRNRRIQRLTAAHVGRHQGRVKRHRLAVTAAKARNPHRDRPDPGHHLALRLVPVAHHDGSTVRQPPGALDCQQLLQLRLHRLRHQLPGAAAKKLRQLVPERLRPLEPKRCTLSHGVPPLLLSIPDKPISAGSFELRVGQAVCGLSVWKSSLPAMRKKAMRMVSNRL